MSPPHTMIVAGMNYFHHVLRCNYMISQNTRAGLEMLGISKANQTFLREVKVPQLQPSIVFQKSTGPQLW